MILLLNLLFAFLTKSIYAVQANKPLILYGTIVTPTAEVLKESQDGAELITTLQKGTTVKIRGTNLNGKWLFVYADNKKIGWIKKENLNYTPPVSLNFELNKVIGEDKSNGILVKAGLIFANNEFLYILEKTYPYNLIKFTIDGEYLQNIPITYSWIKYENQLNYIVLIIDKENIYTNANAPNILSQYTQEGKFQKDIIKDRVSSINDVFYDLKSNQLYCLDVKEKSVKIFTTDGKLSKLIFLSQSQNPKKMAIDTVNKQIYILDSNSFYDTYIVKADVLNVRSMPGTDAPVITTVNSNSFIKVLLDKVEAKDKSNYKWVKIEVSENNYGYVALEFLQKIKALGEIQLYSYEGELKNIISLKNTLLHQSQDNFRLYPDSNIIRELNDINFVDSSGLFVAIGSFLENTYVSSINICKIEGKNFISYDTVNGNTESKFAVTALKFFISNNSGTVSVLNNEGTYLEEIGQKNKYKPALIQLLGINKDDNIIIFDKRLNTISLWKDFKIQKEINLVREEVDEYQLLTLITIDEQNILTGEKVYKEEKLIRFLDIFSNGEITYSPFLSYLQQETKAYMGLNRNNERILITKGKSLHGDAYIQIFDKNNTSLRIWENMGEIFNVFPPEELKNINIKDAEIIGFNQKGEAYLKVKDKKATGFILYRLMLNSKNPCKIMDKINFYEALESFNANLPDIKKIILSNYGFTYILYSTEKQNNCISIFSPIGNLVKNIETDKNLQDMIIDSKENIFIADYFGVYRLILNQ